MPEEYMTPREASSVILVRERDGGEVEVFLLRRHRKASFMSSAFVFPGGAADEGEDDPRVTAARELFEEAGVLIADAEVDAATREAWREAANDPEAEALAGLMDAAEVGFDVGALRYFAHWVTPSIERKRFSARFYLAALPPGQEPSFDNKETVDEIWVTPAEALARAGELRLPPPQVRTFWEMREAAARGLDALMALAKERAAHPFPIMPRLRPMDAGFALLLPWDPEYASHGTGDFREMPEGHPLAVGPSRFVLEDTTWKNVDAPSSARGG